MIRVTQVITRLIRGGGDENCIQVSNNLNPDVYEISLICGGQSRAEVVQRLAPHVKVVVIPELVREISPVNDVVALGKVLRFLRHNRTDIVHTRMAKGGVIGRLAGALAGCKVVHNLHGRTFHEELAPLPYGLYWSLEKLSGAYTDLFISVGEDLKSWYTNAGIGVPQNYHVVYSGMEIDRFQAAANMPVEKRVALREALGVPPDTIAIGKVGRLTHGKGHSLFFEVAQQLLGRHPNLRFLVIGDGELRAALEQECRDRDIDDAVIFTGYRTDIADVLGALDIKAFTSLWEGLPRVLVQASAAGVPVVSFEVGGAWEVVEHGVNGYLVPIKDTAGMVHYLDQLIVDPDARDRIASQARDHAGERFSIAQNIARIESLYRKVAPEVHAS